MSDVHAEVAGDASQTGGVALTHGPELPVGAVSVKFAEHHGRLGGGVLREVIARNLAVVRLVHDADVGVADLAEVLPSSIGLIDGNGKHDPVKLGGRARKVDLDLLVVPAALAREVVAAVLDR